MRNNEFTSVAQANGGLENMINWEGRTRDEVDELAKGKTVGKIKRG